MTEEIDFAELLASMWDWCTRKQGHRVDGEEHQPKRCRPALDT